jgi:hypothetical protein
MPVDHPVPMRAAPASVREDEKGRMEYVAKNDKPLILNKTIFKSYDFVGLPQSMWLFPIEINKIEQVSGIWQLSAVAVEAGVCPTCHVRSSHRHGHYWRQLQGLPIHGSGLHPACETRLIQ